ncbi:MAG: hypothetical protein ACO3JL_20510 [Myxococcota bacterium]
MTTSIFFASLLSLTSSGVKADVANRAVAASPRPTSVQSASLTEPELEQLDFFERRAAFALNDDLHPSLEDNLLPFFVGGLCAPCGGPLWCPLLVIQEQPQGYINEALLTWLTWAAVLWAGSVASAVPWVGWAFGALYCPTALFVSCYLMPVNIINAWDRAAKVYGMKSKEQASWSPVTGKPVQASRVVEMPY